MPTHPATQPTHMSVIFLGLSRLRKCLTCAMNCLRLAQGCISMRRRVTKPDGQKRGENEFPRNRRFIYGIQEDMPTTNALLETLTGRW